METLDERIKVRVPGEMKSQLQGLAKQRLLKEADIVREALLEYLQKQAPAVQKGASS